MLMLRQSPGQRVIYLLREGFDFSFAEIAEILQTSVPKARQQAHRARTRAQITMHLAQKAAEEGVLRFEFKTSMSCATLKNSRISPAEACRYF